jgi:predicted O-methyltransferase YrrM
MRKEILYSAQKKYLASLLTEQEPLLNEMEEFAAQNKIPILLREAAEFLEQMISIKRPKNVLEIGMAIGYSSIRIASRLKDKATLDTIEISKPNIKTAKKYIAISGLEEKINIIEGDALLLMPQMDKKYDLIFLDADKEDYEKLFYYSILLLKKRGVIIVDNLLWHGFPASRNVPPSYKKSTEHVRKFNKLFVSQKALDTTILSIGDGIGLGVKLD